MKFKYRETYCAHRCDGGQCLLQVTQMGQTQRTEDKPRGHTALRIPEGSMIKRILNISANFLHIKRCFKHLD